MPGDSPLVTVIIPVWRDEAALRARLDELPRSSSVEIVVATTLGEDAAYAALRERHRDVRWVSAPRGRSSQMNAGAAAARGRWLLFLHADSRLPLDWLDVLADADARPTVAAGAFRFALDSRRWQARLIEVGVRMRVAVFRLPYGDQALFVRRHVFESLGGYREWPLMEDVDLVRRVRRVGRLVVSSSAVCTSARRWERDGWVRRSAQNLLLATRFMAGERPSKLAQRYHRRNPRAVVIMTRAPWSGGKTRLTVGRGISHAAVRDALFLDTLDVARAYEDADHVVACEPPEECDVMRERVGPQVDVIAQRGGSIGERMAHAFEDVFRLGSESIVLIGSDLPDLPVDRLEKAFAVLSADSNRVVIGPAADGGYYLIGMNRSHPGLFDGVDWSTARVLDQTLAAARRLHLSVALLDEWHDIDDSTGVARLLSSKTSSAPRTRLALEEHRSRPSAADVRGSLRSG